MDNDFTWDKVELLSGDIPDGFSEELIIYNFPKGNHEYLHKKKDTQPNIEHIIVNC